MHNRACSLIHFEKICQMCWLYHEYWSRKFPIAEIENNACIFQQSTPTHRTHTHTHTHTHVHIYTGLIGFSGCVRFCTRESCLFLSKRNRTRSGRPDACKKRMKKHFNWSLQIKKVSSIGYLFWGNTELNPILPGLSWSSWAWGAGAGGVPPLINPKVLTLSSWNLV